MQEPRQFELEYIGSDGEKHRPVMIHRTIFGSIERFIGILTEHFAGAFPLWLSPVQAMVIPISDAHHDYAQKIKEQLIAAGIRAEADYRSEKMNAKIRDAQLQKIPYMLVVGDKEVADGTVAVRARNEERGGTKALQQQIDDMLKEIKDKDIF
jgi:Threonyl-tRNA synthetase